MIVDTSFLYAFYNEEDPFHKEAMKILKESISKRVVFILPEYVLGETATLLLYRRNLDESIKFIDAMKSTEFVEIFNFSPKDLDGIIEIYKKQKHQLSFVDTSVVYLAKIFDSKVATFDRNIVKEVKRFKKS